jgi:hypothetical protein
MNFLTVVPFDLEKQMSIESNLASIATSLATIAEALTKHAPQAHQVVPAPVAPAPAPVAPVAPVVTTPMEVVVPVAVAPVVAPAPACPITDQPSLVAYVMASYKEMGPVKGNQIQGVLAALGITNINEAKPEQYAAIHSGVEALKAQ